VHENPIKTPSAQTPVFSVLISGLQLQNITIKPLLFHLIKKKISLRGFVCAVISLRTYAWTYIQVLVKPALGLAIEVSLVKAIVKLGTGTLPNNRGHGGQTLLSRLP
jgi:hypothetical protein